MTPGMWNLCRTRADYRAMWLSKVSLDRLRATPQWSIWKKASSLVSAGIKFIQNGCQLSSAELVASRKSICEACPLWQGRCTICGCGGIKWHVPDVACPADPPRWSAVTMETPATRWAVAIPTVPRKNVTLDRTLAGLRRAGWSSAAIFAEPNSPMPDDLNGIEWHQNGEQFGPLLNWHQCFRWALNTGAEMILIVEDDLAICSGLRPFVESVAPRDGVVSLIRSEKFDPGESPWGKFDWSRYEWYWLAQALVWPRAIAERFYYSDIYRDQWPGPNQGDIAIGEWCKQTGTPLYVPTPSFVQHVGTSNFGSWSAAWDHGQNGHGTQANDFIGEDFNILSAGTA